MPLAEAITLIWPHGQVVLHQGDGRLQACQPVAAFSPGMPSMNCSRTTCPQHPQIPLLRPRVQPPRRCIVDAPGSWERLILCHHLALAVVLRRRDPSGPRWPCRHPGSSPKGRLSPHDTCGSSHVAHPAAGHNCTTGEAMRFSLKARVDLLEECSVCRLWSEMMSYTMLLFNGDFICVFLCFGHVC